MHQRLGVPGSFREFPGVFQDLQLTEIAPNLQFPELANNCARPAAALRDFGSVQERPGPEEGLARKAHGVVLRRLLAELGRRVRRDITESGRRPSAVVS